VKELVILVHGFNVWDGGISTVGKLRPFFAEERYPYIMLDYGTFDIVKTYLKNKKVAKEVATACENAKLSGYEVIVVGHSNGCAIIDIASKEFNAPIKKAVYINPALNKDKERSPTVGSIDVWHSPSDKPVKWAKLLPFHPWGEMGATGYIGEDPKIVNYNKEDMKLSSSEHSDMFSTELLPFYGRLVVKTAQQQ
jgi:pimeloyl-ACP methyl ester carboxylesterase